MFGSSMLDIAVGVVFVFLLLSIFATAINEIILSRMNLRGKFLLRGIQSLMNEDVDDKPLALVTKLYNHGQICGLYKGSFTLDGATAKTTQDNLPSYIPSRNFALALLEIVKDYTPAQPPPAPGGQPATPPAVDAQPMPAPATDPPATPFAKAIQLKQEADIALARAQDAIEFAKNAASDTLHEATAKAQQAFTQAQNAVAAQALHALQNPAAALPTVTAAVKDTVTISQALRDGAAALASNTATEKVGKPLVSMIRMADNDAHMLQKAVEDWYNSAMDRVSGWYKYRTQWVLFFIGIVIAIGLNADTINIVQQLSKDSTLRQSIVAAAKSAAQPPASTPAPASPAPATTATNTATDNGSANPDTLQQANAAPPQAASPTTPPPSAQDPPAPSTAPAPTMAQQITAAQDSFGNISSLGIPLGWPQGAPKLQRVWHNPGDCAAWRAWLLNWSSYGKLLGWIFTAIAISLGAPFWFDALNKIMVIRSTVKPTEKSPNEPSKS